MRESLGFDDYLRPPQPPARTIPFRGAINLPAMTGERRMVLLALGLIISGGTVAVAQQLASPPARLRAVLVANAESRDRSAEILAAAPPLLTAIPRPVAQIVSQGRLKSDPERIRSSASLADM